MLTRIASAALDLLFPLSCLGCHREGAFICPDCVLILKRLERPYCQRCAQPGRGPICRRCLDEPLAIDSIRAHYLFEGTVREAVHRLKYRRQRSAAAPLAQLMAGPFLVNEAPVDAAPVGLAPVDLAPVDLITPVPLHPARLRQRGYNQSFLLARETGRILGIPVQDGLLSRVKNSPPQVEARSREQRKDNVADSFECRGPIQDRSVLLIDDVATTGSTLAECAAVLKSNGAKAVHALVLAREV